MTRREALEALLVQVEAATRPAFMDGFAARAFPPESDDGHCTFHDAVKAFNGSLDAAKALVKATLPGWGYGVCVCHLTDEAAVFPDFNCPEHGPRLRAELDESVDWADLTDTAQAPAGNPARALLRSVLLALIAQEGEE